MKYYSVLIVLALAALLAAAGVAISETAEKQEAEVKSACYVASGGDKAQCVPCPTPCPNTTSPQSCVTATGDTVRCIPCPSPCTTPQGSSGCDISGKVCVPDKATCCPGGEISGEAADYCKQLQRRSI
ncbi:MAG: hypothetical protein WBC88_04735 [Candidatus Zixiibacteriota bacterium]